MEYAKPCYQPGRLVHQFQKHSKVQFQYRVPSELANLLQLKHMQCIKHRSYM